MSEDTGFNWQVPCGKCTTQCCSRNSFVVDAIGYAAMQAAGHPDYLTKVVLESPDQKFETHYVNDYRQGSCAYHDAARGCTIQDPAIKPKICQAFPALLLRDAKKHITGVAFDNKCPATRFLDDEAKGQLAEIVYANAESMTGQRYLKVFGAYELRDKPGRLAAMGATVTPGKDKIAKR